MFMGSVGTSVESQGLRELTGARVLITGLTSAAGVDVARAFADTKSRLVIHTSDLAPDIIELVALLSQTAGEIKLHTHDISSADASAAFAQTSAQTYGGLEAAINITSISHAEIARLSADGDLEALVTTKLTPLAQLTRVVANRMRVVFSEGLILNILKMPHPENAREAAVAAFARTALAAMTSREARDWASSGIRVNAVGPRVVAGPKRPEGACLTNEPDIASLALHLASRHGRSFSGHVFDADGLEF